ncbi:hypothetical protein SEPCBS119000_004424 [Sporothrix epigloea]|uniref:Carrier domain-containing protein n=1 Tax=Sporothrix epigloea TaxID=1892477 RepID=A0ABP0DT83_9PEZI
MGDSVLIFGPSTVYGQAAIRVASALGGNVLVACTTADEKFIAQEHFKINPSHIIDMKTAGDKLDAYVLALTQQLGVDVVFDPTSCHIEQAFAYVAEYSVCCAIEHNMRDLKAALIQASEKPFVGSHVLFTEADKGPNLVNVHTQSTSDIALSSSATYVLVGGLGGLGRSIAEHLVRRGAKHIAFVSRSGASSASAQSMLVKMQTAGIDAQVFTTDDAAFPSMNYERWERSFNPKVIGSINLHEQLPQDMDFFIFLSSSSGVIGNRGQANYAAGNSFQDALARHRTALGMHSVSINLGLVLGAGMVAENEGLLDAMKASGFIGIRMQDALSVLDRAMDRSNVKTRLPVPSQIVTAVGTGGLTIQNEPSDPFWTQTALFRYLNQVDAPPHGLNSEARRKAGQDLQSMIRASDTLDEATQIVCTALIDTMARRKCMISEDFDRYQSFDSYGIDSLDSMFLLGWISRETGVTVQTVEGVTIAELGQIIARRSRLAVEEERQ